MKNTPITSENIFKLAYELRKRETLAALDHGYSITVECRNRPDSESVDQITALMEYTVKVLVNNDTVLEQSYYKRYWKDIKIISNRLVIVLDNSEIEIPFIDNYSRIVSNKGKIYFIHVCPALIDIRKS